MLDESLLCLDELIHEVLARAGVTGPPVDMLQVAHALELKIARDNRQTGRARMVRRPSHDGSDAVAILVRQDDRVERMQWSIAHELGETLAAQAFQRLDWDARTMSAGSREQIANQLANRLLLPAEWFGPDSIACQRDLLALKARYSTASHELIGRRLLDFPPHSITAIFDQGRLTRRLGNLQSRLPPLLPCERDAQQRAFATAASVDSTDGEIRCRAWAIHEPDWKREIIRTEFPEPCP